MAKSQPKRGFYNWRNDQGVYDYMRHMMLSNNQHLNNFRKFLMEVTGNVTMNNKENILDMENTMKMYYSTIEMLFMIEVLLRKSGVSEQDIINLKSFSEYTVNGFHTKI